jgi:DNA topoisomerase IA
VIGGDDKRYSRVVFNEITKNAIRQAFEKPGELNIDRVNAQQARRFMDRVVGYMVSPLLWKKIARGLSAGRSPLPCVWSLSASAKLKPLSGRVLGSRCQCHHAGR